MTKWNVRLMNFKQSIKLAQSEKVGEGWDLMEFKIRKEDIITDLIFFNSCKKGSCNKVTCGSALSNLLTFQRSILKSRFKALIY